MNEMTALNTEYSSIAPNKSLEIPQQLQVSNIDLLNGFKDFKY